MDRCFSRLRARIYLYYHLSKGCTNILGVRNADRVGWTIKFKSIGRDMSAEYNQTAEKNRLRLASMQRKRGQDKSKGKAGQFGPGYSNWQDYAKDLDGRKAKKAFAH